MHTELAVFTIMHALRVLNTQLPKSKQIPVSDDTKLIGPGGHLDSMGLVTLLLIVEEAVQEKYHETITISDEKALSQERSPFRDVKSLAEYVGSKLKTA
jgi:acyl carrier protein